MTQNHRELRREETNRLTEKIIGIAIKIHRALGPGFVEKIYEKVLSKIIELFEHQMLSYLKTSGKRVGLILNFGGKSLEIKRIVHKF